jgi:hypothetical protein
VRLPDNYIKRIITAFAFLIMALIAHLPAVHAQDNDPLENNVNQLAKTQLKSCQQMCMSEGQKCMGRGAADAFCDKRETGCISSCAACITSFSLCMKAGDQTVAFCQDPFNACLEEKLSASEPR